MDVIHVIEAGELADFGLVQAEQCADLRHYLGWEPTVLTLGNVQCRPQRGAGHGITGLERPNFSNRVFGKHEVLRQAQKPGFSAPLSINVAQYDVNRTDIYDQVSNQPVLGHGIQSLQVMERGRAIPQAVRNT